MQKFLSDIVIPFYQAQITSNLNFVLYSVDYTILIASNSVLKHLEFSSLNEIRNKKLTDFSHIKPEMLTKLQCIFKKVLQEKQAISFVGIGGQVKSKFKNYHELIFQRYEPIFDHEQNVVAVLAKKLPTINQNLFNLFLNKQNTINNNQELVDRFSTREFEILYLLSNGLSQYEIAEKLGVTRSTILKYLNDRILKKLCLNENNSENIIKAAITLGIHSKIPKTLIKEQIIVIQD